MDKISIKKIVNKNKKFGGSLINKSNLEYCVEMANKEKNIYKSNAYLVRGIIVNHPFLDENKRTAVDLIVRRFEKHGIKCDERGLVKGLTNVAKENLNDVNKISNRLRKWCKIKN
ncbi:Fic family protein [Candidatus Pacearchaeota archaeon]|nr:Fic family protein [Candidatus Pacearchaeota archaeon]